MGGSDYTYTVDGAEVSVNGYISAAYHESGHIIYGLLHLMKIESAQVYFDNKNLKTVIGYTDYDYPGVHQTNNYLEFPNIVKYEIGICYAGLAAEQYSFKLVSGSDKFPVFFKDYCSGDTKEASSLLKKCKVTSPGKKRYNYKKKLIKQVFIDLEKYWDSVTLIAHALFQRKRLYFNDIKRILTKKGEHQKFWKTRFRLIEHINKNKETFDEKDFEIILVRRGLV
jgi:hypothetical protein